MNSPLIAVFLAPFLAQGLFMTIDEFHYHRKRGLGRWERWGHPVDTVGFLIPIAFASQLQNPTPARIAIFAVLALGSCVLITKDEWIHTRECEAAENWVHSVLFVLHPVVLLGAAGLGFFGYLNWLAVECGALVAWLSFQIIYWNFIRAEHGERTLSQ